MRDSKLVPTVRKFDNLSCVRASSPPAAVARATVTKLLKSLTSKIYEIDDD